jgi:hypothetical protein
MSPSRPFGSNLTPGGRPRDNSWDGGRQAPSSFLGSSARRLRGTTHRDVGSLFAAVRLNIVSAVAAGHLLTLTRTTEGHVLAKKTAKLASLGYRSDLACPREGGRRANCFQGRFRGSGAPVKAEGRWNGTHGARKLFVPAGVAFETQLLVVLSEIVGQKPIFRLCSARATITK